MCIYYLIFIIINRHMRCASYYICACALLNNNYLLYTFTAERPRYKKNRKQNKLNNRFDVSV